MNLEQFKKELLESLERPEEWEKIEVGIGEDRLVHKGAGVYFSSNGLRVDQHLPMKLWLITDPNELPMIIDEAPREAVRKCHDRVVAITDRRRRLARADRVSEFLREFEGFFSA